VIAPAPRTVRDRYVDPLAEVWLGAARRIGLRVERRPDAYASTDGRGTLVIGSAETLDADDSLAQMIFHELCHSLVQGEDSFARADWGLDNETPRDAWRERATLRLQRTLAARVGLARFFAPTTEYRAFWDALGADPLADRADPSVVAAIAGLHRATRAPWAPALEDALVATAAIVAAAAPFAAPDSLAAGFAVPPPHPTGLPAAPSADRAAPTADLRPADGASADDRTADDRRCGTCAWRTTRRGRARCLQAARGVDDAWPACERWEPALDCQTCGACCREAYHAVAVAPRDLVRTRAPAYVVDRAAAPGAPPLAPADRYQLARIDRPGPTPDTIVNRCAALAGGDLVPAPGDPDRLTTTRVHCVIYDDRPRTCRDFTLGSTHCLTARRRVGLSL
jgi:Fe-S-cluster containining protein